MELFGDDFHQYNNRQNTNNIYIGKNIQTLNGELIGEDKLDKHTFFKWYYVNEFNHVDVEELVDKSTLEY